MDARERSEAAWVRPQLEGAGIPYLNGSERGPDGALPRLEGIRIVATIGSGLRGTVYKATDGRRTFAVKVFRRGSSADRAVLSRFGPFPPSGGGPEARESSDLIRHPAIAPIEALGETEDGLTYSAMPLLRGDPLERLIADLKRGACDRPHLSPLAIETDGGVHPRFMASAAETFAEVAEGIGAAHAHGIRHRRLTPRNLIFTPAGRLLVTDFGGDSSTAGDGLAYRAPEELGPFPEEAGPEADVYALGVMLYEVLTRRSPFAAFTPAELKRAIVKGRFPVPRSFSADIPAPLEAIVLKAMARSAEERYRNAGELAADLRRFLRHEMPLAIRQARLPARAEMAAGPPADGSTGTAASRKAAARARTGRHRSFAGGERVHRRVAAAAIAVVLAAAAWWAGSHVLGPGPAPTGLSHGPLHLSHGRDAAGGTLAPPGGGHQGSLPAVPPGGPRRENEASGSLARAAFVPGAGDHFSPVTAPEHHEANLLPRAAGPPRPAPANLLGIRSDFIDGLLLAGGEEPPILAGDSFAALQAEVGRLAGHEPAAARALCLWDLDLAAAMDLGPRPASVTVPPGLRVELAARDPRDFTAAWVRARSMTDPGALLAPELLAAIARGAVPPGFGETGEEEALGRKAALLRDLLAALVGTGGAGARRAAALIARDHYVTNGKDALEALAALSAHEELAILARSALPVPLRETALLLLGEKFAGLAAPELRSIALTSPEGALRRAAFHALARLGDASAAAVLPRLLEDPDLRGEALAVLAGLPREAAAGIALDLLADPDAGVRARAVDAAAAGGGDILRPLVLRLLSPKWTVREAAFAALAARDEVPRIGETFAGTFGAGDRAPEPFAPRASAETGPAAIASAAEGPGG